MKRTYLYGIWSNRNLAFVLNDPFDATLGRIGFTKRSTADAMLKSYLDRGHSVISKRFEANKNEIPLA